MIIRRTSADIREASRSYAIDPALFAAMAEEHVKSVPRPMTIAPGCDYPEAFVFLSDYLNGGSWKKRSWSKFVSNDGCQAVRLRLRGPRVPVTSGLHFADMNRVAELCVFATAASEANKPELIWPMLNELHGYFRRGGAREIVGFGLSVDEVDSQQWILVGFAYRWLAYLADRFDIHVGPDDDGPNGAHDAFGSFPTPLGDCAIGSLMSLIVLVGAFSDRYETLFRAGLDRYRKLDYKDTNELVPALESLLGCEDRRSPRTGRAPVSPQRSTVLST